MELVAAIDQGTTSTRCILFGREGIIATAQKEHRQICPRPGWVEHDPMEIWQATRDVIGQAVATAAGRRIVAVGITNQRETLVVWDRATGEPLANAIVWQDTRSDAIVERLARDGGKDRFRSTTGLPLATYFTGPKLRWLQEHDPRVRAALASGQACAGTIDSWLAWCLTGGPSRDGGQDLHITDVTNASRTMLMNLATLDWDADMLKAMGIDRRCLPTIVPSNLPGGHAATRPDGPFGAAIPIAAILGDQQAALVGQACLAPGECKNTYGTGCFMLLNTGVRIVHSTAGLLTTVAYRFANEPPAYALEGSIAVTGALVQWLRDNLGFIRTSAEVEALAASVPDTGGAYIVPAFSGLFAPYWRSDARGTICGLTRFTHRAHLARAALEATAYQTRDVLDAMLADAGVAIPSLKVDGGMTANDLLMQFQADMLGVPVVRPKITETTALGAACAAGLAAGFWLSREDLRATWQQDRVFEPQMPAARRDALYAGWKKAVERSLGWA